MEKSMHTYKDSRNNTVDIFDNNKTLLTKITSNINCQFNGNNSHVTIINAKIKFLNIALSNNCTIVIKDKSIISDSASVFFYQDNTSLIIGNNTSIGNATFQLDEPDISITIGNFCVIGHKISFRSGDGHTIFDIKSGRVINHPGDIRIGNHVWVGREVLFLKNACIPDNCIVGARSLVNHSYSKENCIYAGIPAKLVKENVNWDNRPTFMYLNDMANSVT